MYLASYMEMRYMGHEPSQHLECVYRKLVSQISQICSTIQTLDCR